MVEVIYRFMMVVVRIFILRLDFCLLIYGECKVMEFFFYVMCVIVFFFFVGIVMDCKNYIVNFL